MTTMKQPNESLSRSTEDVADSLAAVIKRELTIYSCHEGYLNPSDPTIITADDRRKLVDWCYGVVDHCQLSREVVASAMDMVDRFLAMPSCSTDEALHDESKFQLLTITALYVAIKVNELVVVSSDLFAEMSRDAYTAKEIEDMELTLLSGLSWRCNAPTAFQVGHSILSLILHLVKCSEVTWGFLLDEMKYLTELAVRDCYFSTQRKSTVALGATFNSIGHINIGSHERQQLLEAFLCIVECFDFDDPKLVVAASKRLHRLLQQENYDDDVTEEMMEMEVLEASSKYPEMRSIKVEVKRDKVFDSIRRNLSSMDKTIRRIRQD